MRHNAIPEARERERKPNYAPHSGHLSMRLPDSIQHAIAIQAELRGAEASIKMTLFSERRPNNTGHRLIYILYQM